MFLEKGVFDQAQTKYNTGPSTSPLSLETWSWGFDDVDDVRAYESQAHS